MIHRHLTCNRFACTPSVCVLTKRKPPRTGCEQGVLSCPLREKNAGSCFNMCGLISKPLQLGIRTLRANAAGSPNRHGRHWVSEFYQHGVLAVVSVSLPTKASKYHKCTRMEVVDKRSTNSLGMAIKAKIWWRIRNYAGISEKMTRRCWANF